MACQGRCYPGTVLEKVGQLEFVVSVIKEDQVIWWELLGWACLSPLLIMAGLFGLLLWPFNL